MYANGGDLYDAGERFSRLSPSRQERRHASGGWEGDLKSICPVRGIYFATHYGNFYEAAPETDIRHYLTELGSWGMNVVGATFSTWQFDGFDDPAARKLLSRLKTIFAPAVHQLKFALFVAPNQGFKSAPAELRFVPFPDDWKRRGYHGVNICPSKPEGRDYLLDLYQRLFREFAHTGIDYLVLWPYDEGGCGCEKCWPWGSEGFLRISEEIAESAKKIFPRVQIVLSTWMFDTPPTGEWEGLAEKLSRNRGWVDYIMADSHEDFPRYPLEHGVPGDLPLLNFPEISMWGMSPWGGYGANPLPDRLQRLWRQVKDRVSGGFAYSEGIFEDMNKVLVLQWYRQRDAKAEEILRRYVSFHFSPEVVDEVVQAIGILEHNHTRPKEDAGSRLAKELLEQAQTKLEPAVRDSWRWRILYLRALLDFEHYTHRGRKTRRAKEALQELTRIYHAEKAWSILKPSVE